MTATATTAAPPSGSTETAASVAPPLERRRLVAVAITTVAAVVAGLELRRIFDLATIGPAVALVAMAGAAGPTLARWRRLPAVVGPLVSLLLGLVAVAVTVDDVGAVGGVLPGPELVRTVIDAVVDGWAQILSTGIPAPPRPTMVLVAPLLAWAAAWLGAELVLRVRALAIGVLPAVAALVAASVLVVPAGGSRLPAAVLLAACAVALLLVASAPDAEAGVPTVRPVRAGLMAVAVLVLGALAAPHLPWIGAADTKDPRPDDPRPEQQVTPVNPLSLLAGWAAEPDELVATVRTDRPAPLRLGVLDRYDGTAWSATTVLQVAGSTLPPARVGASPAGTRTTLRITLDDLAGTFLPAPEQPVGFEGPAAWWDPGHGLLYRQGATTGDDEVRYEVTSVVPTPPEQVGDRPVDDSDPRTLDVPGAPARLGALSLQVTPAGTTPYARALLLESYLRELAVFDADAPSGSSWSTLEYFLLRETDDGGRRGTSEQFATAFAVLARLQGLPSRVVVGARPPAEVGETWEVRAGDLEAWPEVRFEGIGWVAFDPTPARTDAPPPTTTTTSPPTTQPELPPERTDALPPATVEGGGEGDDGAPEPARSLGERVAELARPVGLGVLALVLLLPVLVVLAKVARRRRRRRAPSEGAQVLGAWDEVADDLRARGLLVTTASSRRRIAGHAAPMVGDDVAGLVDDLARLANAVTFSGAAPPEGLGRRAWGLVDRIRAASAAGQPPWRRAARAADPRTLRRPRPPRPGRAGDASTDPAVRLEPVAGRS